jgi:putative flippase GtrA
MKNQILDIYRNKKLTAKFGIIGGVGFICNFTVLKLLIEFADVNRILAEVLAAAVALQITFILHDRWTYRIDKALHKYHLSVRQRYQAYIMSNSFASLLTVIFFAIFSVFFTHLPALVLAAIVGMVWNFLANKNIIWHHKPHDKT